MHRYIIPVFALVMLLSLGQAALAFGRFGATDLMETPTSGTLSEDAFAIFGSFAEGGTVLFGMDFGLIPDLELGLSILCGSGWQTASLRLKYHLLSEQYDGFGLAVGIQDIGQGTISPYVVAGKTLAPDFQGYLGIGGGWMEGIFFGLNKRLKTQRQADLFLEYDGAEANFGGRVKLTQNVGLDVGLAGLDRVVVGVNYLSRF